MKELKELLSRWRAVEPRRLTLGSIKLDAQYQPRNIRLLPYAERPRAESASETHVDRLAEVIADGDVDPLLVADLDGRLVLIDGHHRLRAYRRALKHTAPARVLKVSPKDALLVSKLVNCDGVKLALHDEQARECAWQYLAEATQRGRFPLPKEISNRAVGRAFGTSRETVGSMLRKLPEVSPSDFHATACDLGTGWPLWKYVKGNTWRDQFQNVADDVRERQQTERLASRISQMMTKHGHARFLNALQLVEHEQIDVATEAAERIAARAGEAEPEY